MALINCPECKKEVSKKAKACPHCGFILKKKMGCFKWGLIIILAIIVLFVIEVSTQDKSKGKDNAGLVEAYRASENYMERQLKSPKTADFPGVLTYKNHVKKMENGQWIINSYVDSQNGFGAIVRTNFSCTVVKVGGRYKVQDFKTN